MNHRLLVHPHIIKFNEVFVTPTHLVTAMEYASGGELFEYVRRSGRLSEDASRFFFQQLISGVDFCHQVEFCGHAQCCSAEILSVRATT